MGADRRAAVRRGRAYMTIHGGRGAPMVYGVEAFEYEARPDGVVPRRNCCLLVRASAVEGRIRSEYEAAGERGRSYEAMEGSTVLQDSVGAFKRGRRLGPASY